MDHHALTLTAVVAVMGSGVLGASLPTGPDAAEDRPVAGPTYPTNAAGQTYGTDALADREEDFPDLIAAYATNGKVGYVRNDDLIEVPPASPAEAVARQKWLDARFAPGDVVRVIPVFAKDGSTVVGEFEIVHGSSGGSPPDAE
jgi:hypothetical protein